MVKPEDLLLLYDRPREPVFATKLKGDKTVTLNVPDNFLTEKYKTIGPNLANRFSEEASETINVQGNKIPDLSGCLEVKRDENFTLLLPKHSKCASRLVEILLNAKNLEELLSCAAYARDRVNPYLFNYSLSVAIFHRKDTHDLDIPTFIEAFPDKYINSQSFVKAREECYIVPQGSRMPIEIPVDYTASNLDPEHRIAYWREDLGINLHHWHWHLVFPFEGPREIVDKNRRGELFYYQHQQIVARYNFERFCNQLPRVQRWINWREPIPEGYFPKLNSLVSSRAWPARLENQQVQNVNRELDQISIDIEDLLQYRDRIFEAIHTGFIIDEQGNRVPLTENEGIDVLGNVIESTILSPNRTFYGNLHNLQHVVLGVMHDPDNRHLEPVAVMGDPAVDMRDPMFYRLHAYIDDMFQEYKATIPRYSVDRLKYDGVTVTNVSVQSQKSKPNVFNTFWQQSDVNLSRGLDFQPRGPVFARFTHLQHQPFDYVISVNNTGKQRRGTCRIFLAPKSDERGNPWLFRDQRNMFIEMDRFFVTLKQGANTITRKSTDSAVTVPFERTFRSLDNRPAGGLALDRFNLCGCGWPQYLLLPKGTPEGFPCHLFVMISNFDDDNINQTLEGECNDAPIFCGVRNKLYPDRRSMGFPFDRLPRNGVDSLQQFLTPNMRVQEVSIVHQNRTIRPKTAS